MKMRRALLLAAAAALPAPATRTGWRWCHRCASLWRPGLPHKACPAGQGLGHSSVGSGNYLLKVETDGGPGQAQWRLCTNCQAFWWRGNGHAGRCAGSPLGHNEAGLGTISPRYLLETASVNTGGNGQSHWKYCCNCHVLVHNPTGTNSVGRCASLWTHDTTDSRNYRLKLA